MKAERVLLQPFSLNFTVARNLCSWYTKVPTVQLAMKVDKLKVCITMYVHVHVHTCIYIIIICICMCESVHFVCTQLNIKIIIGGFHKLSRVAQLCIRRWKKVFMIHALYDAKLPVKCYVHVITSVICMYVYVCI